MTLQHNQQMETTQFTEVMKDFLVTASQCFSQFELAAKELLQNPTRPLDKTKYQATTETKLEMTQEDIDAKIIELSKKARKIPSQNFTDKVKKECGLTKDLANEAIQRLIKDGSIEEKELKEKEK